MFIMAYQIVHMATKTCGKCLQPPRGYKLSPFSLDTIHLAIGNFVIVVVFLHSVFFIISVVTTTTATPPVTVV